jgi:hypothetical protein
MYDENHCEKHGREYAAMTNKQVKEGNELVNLICLMKIHAGDLRDSKLTKVFVILHGTAILIETNTLPAFFFKDYKQMVEKDMPPGVPRQLSDQVRDQHMGSFNKMKLDKTRMTWRTLIILPENQVVSADMTPAVPYDVKKLMNKNMYPTNVQTVPATLENNGIEQTFSPVVWKIRLISEEDSALVVEDRDTDDEDDLVNCMISNFAGMHIDTSLLLSSTLVSYLNSYYLVLFDILIFSERQCQHDASGSPSNKENPPPHGNLPPHGNSPPHGKNCLPHGNLRHANPSYSNPQPLRAHPWGADCSSSRQKLFR